MYNSNTMHNVDQFLGNGNKTYNNQFYFKHYLGIIKNAKFFFWQN